MSFLLHPRLEADTVVLGELPLCRVLLRLDGRYPWVVLVPRREGIREIHELSTEDRAVLVEECAAVSQAMQTTLSADKMNVAALGNMVPQLHVHVVARYEGDDAWPGAPVALSEAEARRADGASWLERLRKPTLPRATRAR